MNGITHQQAKEFILADLDGLLTRAQRLDLEAHLRDCEACRAEADSFATLTTRLQTEFHTRWDAQDGPSEHVLKNIHTQSRRIKMSKRIDFAFNLLGGLAALLVLGFVAISVTSQFQERATTANGAETAVPVAAPRPEDRLIAFTSAIENGNLDIYTMYPDGSGLTNLTHNPTHDMNPVWSPDGKRIAFESDRNGFMHIFLMEADGSNVTQLTDNQADHALTLNIDGEANPWSPDGSKLTLLERPVNEELLNLYVMDINSGNKVLLARGKIFSNSVSWSPNGKFLGFVLNTSTSTASFTPEVYVAAADGSNPRNLKELLPSEENPDARYYWSPNGYTIAFTTQNNRLQQTLFEYDLQTGILTRKTTFEPGVMIDWQENLYLRLQTEQNGQSSFVWQRPDGTSQTFDWDASCWTFDVTRSSQGNFVIGASCPNKQFRLYWANADGSEVKQILDMSMSAAISSLGDITWSPDDQYVALHIATASETNLYILNMAEALENPVSQPVQMTIGGGELYFHPAWQPIIQEDLTKNDPAPQPKDQLIAFVSMDERGNRDIYTMRSDGSGLTNLTDNPATDDSPAWSPDGTLIAFVSDRSGGRDIYIMNSDGSHIRKLTDSSTFNDHFTWSPDGTKIAYLASEESLFTASHLMVMNADGSNKIELAGEPGRYDILGWSPDGQNIVYKIANIEDDRERVMVASADGINTLDGPFFEGDGGRRHYQIHWESSELFITLSLNRDRPVWGMWTLTRFYTTENYTNSVNANPVLVAADFPIVAIFERTYVVENQDSLNWLVYSGAPIPLTPWNFSEICKTPTQPLIEETTHTISPDEQHDFVTLQCPEGTTHFFLVNADGTEVQQLGEALAKPAQVTSVEWSFDGKNVIVTIADNRGTDIFRFDIEKMLNDPSIQPVQLTTDGALKNGAVWQPIQ